MKRTFYSLDARKNKNSLLIPAKPTENLYDDNVHKRVAVYARVSTDDPRQTSSYESHEILPVPSPQEKTNSFRIAGLE